MKTIAGVRIPDTRHVPASHPVLVRARFHAELAKALDGIDAQMAPISAIQVHDQSSRIEDIAQRVALIPDTPLTAQQRRSLHCIARELIRRATGPTFDERS